MFLFGIFYINSENIVAMDSRFGLRCAIHDIAGRSDCSASQPGKTPFPVRSVI